MKKVITSIPCILSAITTILGFILHNQIQDAIHGQGLTGPEALEILGPVLQLIGGLSLIISILRIKPEDEAWSRTEAKRLTHRGIYPSPESRVEAEINFSEILTNLLKRELERKEQLLSISILCIGFTVELLKIFVQKDIPVIWFARIMLILTIFMIILYYYLWDKWRSSGREYALKNLPIY